MIEIFETSEGFGYRVGAIFQEFNPYKEGFVPMTREEAERFSQEVLERIS